jgi:hypothetical protein
LPWFTSWYSFNGGGVSENITADKHYIAPGIYVEPDGRAAIKIVAVDVITDGPGEVIRLRPGAIDALIQYVRQARRTWG